MKKNFTQKGQAKLLSKILKREEFACCNGGGDGEFVLHTADSDCISLSGQGGTLSPLTAVPIISPAAGNKLSCTPDGLYATSAVESVTSGDTNIIVNNDDPKNPVVSAAFNLNLIKTLQDRTIKLYYKLPKNFNTEAIEPITYNGALASATVSKVGPYDKFVVGPGIQTSNFLVNNHLLTDHGCRFVARIKCENLGIAPYIGLKLQQNLAYFNNLVSLGNTIMWVQPMQAIMNATIGTGVYGYGEDYDTGISDIASGDILLLIIQKHVTYKHSWELFVINESTSKFITRRTNAVENIANVAGNPSNPGLILSDGTYTIMDFEIYSQDGEGSKCCILGQFSAVGFNVHFNQTIVGYLNQNIIYRNTAVGGQGTSLLGFVRASIPELFILRPESVVIFDYDSVQQGLFKGANPGNAAFLDNVLQLTEAIRAIGSVPIFVKYQGLVLVSGADITLWNSWVDANAATYGASILDLTTGLGGVGPGMTVVLDGAGVGWASPYTDFVGQKIIELLTSLTLLP